MGVGEDIKNAYRDIHWKLKGAGMAYLLLIGALAVLAYRFTEEHEDRFINVTLVILGIALGWLLGIAASPYEVSEEKRFGKLASAASVFVSGYAVGKMDKLVERFATPEFLLQNHVGFRVVLVVTASVLSLIFTFYFRSYTANLRICKPISAEAEEA